ncbi:V-type ATP synthase subunit I [Candidatus Woesearchaeota archaeon]|nr:V-type ATP synthase subunit I [Candidatus Woesearchaeota archaeon]
MLKPESMSRLVIAGHKEHMQQTINELHQLKVLHIVDHAKNELADIGSPYEKASALSETLIKIRSIMTYCSLNRGSDAESPDKTHDKLSHDKINSRLQAISGQIAGIQESIREYQSRLTKNNVVLAELRKLEDLKMPLEAISAYKSLVYFVGYANDAQSLHGRLQKKGWNFRMYLSQKNPKLMALFIESGKSKEAAEILGQSSFSSLNAALLEELEGLPSKAAEKVSKEILDCSNEAERLGKELAQAGKDNMEFLLAAEKYLSNELEKAEAPLRFAATKNAFFVSGWVPAGNISHVMNRLEKTLKNKLFISFDAPKPKDDVPVKLNNKKYAKPFEFLLDLYSLPIYREFDPTLLIFLTFPIFFGFMLGDIGYGLLSLGIFALMKKKMPKAKNFFNIFMLSSVSTVFFGLLFGEFFGAEEIGHFELWHILSRSHDVMLLLSIAVGIGIVHLNLGLILGFFNERKLHGLKHAIYAKGSWFILQGGTFILIADTINLISTSTLLIVFGFAITYGLLIGSILILLAIIMLIKGEGIIGPIEILGLIGNIGSYSRLMAIGLSSVMLAIVINEMAFEFLHKGNLYILAGILLLLIGHAINMALGWMGSFLHSLRLHYVEFFTKFFHGGGKKYSPFGL